MLGSGTFSYVKVAKCVRLSSCSNHHNGVERVRNLQLPVTATNESSHNQDEGENSSASKPSKDFAVKVLRDDLSRSKHKIGILNLVVEAEFLQTISHPNIVTIHGVGENPGDSNFFIVMDMLRTTLNEEIEVWSESEKQIKCTSPNRRIKNEALLKLLEQRTNVATQISAGINYLHEKK